MERVRRFAGESEMQVESFAVESWEALATPAQVDAY